ncbi:Uncharacterised protein [Vibrio cholerae]|nr:Uncharacterised protein [Vibrio cholerae]
MNIQDVTAAIDFLTIAYVFIKSHPYYIEFMQYLLNQ